MHGAGIAKDGIADESALFKTVAMNAEIAEVADIDERSIDTDWIDPGDILGNIPGLCHFQSLRIDAGNNGTIHLGIVFATFRPVQKPGPDRPLVIVNRSD